MENKKESSLKKRVLIITYYWPPAGGGGVMRWLKMSNYLYRDTDWVPIIYTPENAGYLVVDESLEKEVEKGIEVLKYPILEPNNFLSALGLKKFKSNVASGGVGKNKGGNSKLEKFLIWFRSNFFIPDARMLWIKPSVKYLTKVLGEKKIDAIITTGPPHSMHLIGMKLKQKTGIPWVADFRDPWTFIDFFDDLDLSVKSLQKHYELEQKVLEKADKLVTVSPAWARVYKKKNNADFAVINNGYDPKDFLKVQPPIDKKYTLSYIGSLNKDRNPEILWTALKEISEEVPGFKNDFCFQLIGTIHPEVQEIIASIGLENNISVEKFKAHHEVIDLIRSSQLLLLLINDSVSEYVQGHIPGKLYEYLAANRPILCIGNPESDSAQIIKGAEAGTLVHFNDISGLKKVILENYQQYCNFGSIKNQTKNINKYSRKEEAKQYAELLSGFIQ